MKRIVVFICALCIIAASMGVCASAAESHYYRNDCDATCEHCGAEREVGGHVYDNACDALCNKCLGIRAVGEHVYSNDCDKDCDICGYERGSLAHTYDNLCDIECNACGHRRVMLEHIDSNRDNRCDNCSAGIKNSSLGTVGVALIGVLAAAILACLAAVWIIKRNKMMQS